MEDYFARLDAVLRITGYAVERVIPEGEWVTIMARGRARFLATGAELELPKVDIMRIRDGRILEFREYYNMPRCSPRSTRPLPVAAANFPSQIPAGGSTRDLGRKHQALQPRIAQHDPSDGLPTTAPLCTRPRHPCSPSAMTVLDGTMLGVALPGIARDLGRLPRRTATWLLNAYQLTVVTTLLPLASLGETAGLPPGSS